MTEKEKTQKNKIVLAVGKRKTSVARVRVRAGSGRVTINNIPLDLWKPEYARLKIREPLMLVNDLPSQVDLKVNVRGGGISSQADAIRQGIAKGLVEYFQDENMKKTFLNYNRNLLVYDNRRTEPHKPSRSRKGSRRHKQRSKR